MKKAILAYVLTATAAMAHPGHEAAATQGEAHWLTQADHLIVLAIVAVLAGPVLRQVVRRRPLRRKPGGGYV